VDKQDEPSYVLDQGLDDKTQRADKAIRLMAKHLCRVAAASVFAQRLFAAQRQKVKKSIGRTPLAIALVTDHLLGVCILISKLASLCLLSALVLTSVHPTFAERGNPKVEFDGQTIDAMISEFMKEHHIPGMTLAIV
jgi:hypothetical protein